MKQRCFNPNHPSYPRYGGRGITVCERWLTFANFLADMGVRPKGTNLDREHNDGHYEPGNCRWLAIPENTRRAMVGKPKTVEHVMALRRVLRSDNTSGFRGVEHIGRKFRARVNGKHIGMFQTAEEAHEAVCQVVRLTV